MRNITYAILSLIIFATGYLTGLHRSPPPAKTREIRIFRDTIVLKEPQSVRVIPTGQTIPVAVTPRDTVYIEKETVIYSDSLYYAEISGITPSLDSLVIYPRHTIETVNCSPVTNRAGHPVWGLGIAAGATLTARGLSPGITVGLTYTFATF